MSAVSNCDRASLTRPLEKRERPRLTHDSAVCSAASAVDGEEEEEEEEEEEQATRGKRTLLRSGELRLLRSHGLVSALELASEKQRKWR